MPISRPASSIIAMRRLGSPSGLSSETPTASTVALMIAAVSSPQTKPDESKSLRPFLTSKKVARHCQPPDCQAPCREHCSDTSRLSWRLCVHVASWHFSDFTSGCSHFRWPKSGRGRCHSTSAMSRSAVARTRHVGDDPSDFLEVNIRFHFQSRSTGGTQVPVAD